jgi:hypothetical protein
VEAVVVVAAAAEAEEVPAGAAVEVEVEAADRRNLLHPGKRPSPVRYIP